MDHYTRQIIIDRKLQELRAQGAEARLARSVRQQGTSRQSRLMTLVFGWRTQLRTTTVTAQDRQPAATRPA